MILHLKIPLYLYYHRSRIINTAGKDDDLSTEIVSRKSVSVSKVTTPLSDFDIDSKNRKYSVQQTDSCNIQGVNPTILKSNSSRNRFSHIVIINSDSDESNIE